MLAEGGTNVSQYTYGDVNEGEMSTNFRKPQKHIGNPSGVLERV